MRVMLVRHGQAEDKSDDPARPLTESGARDVSRVAQHATQHMGLSPESVMHSPKTRAHQTAEIWGETVGVAVEVAEGLTPNADPSIWAARVTTHAGDLALVGHLPHLERLAGLLVSGEGASPVVGLPASGVAVLRRDVVGDGWTVAEVLAPGDIPPPTPPPDAH